MKNGVNRRSVLNATGIKFGALATVISLYHQFSSSSLRKISRNLVLFKFCGYDPNGSKNIHSKFLETSLEHFWIFKIAHFCDMPTY